MTAQTKMQPLDEATFPCHFDAILVAGTKIMDQKAGQSAHGAAVRWINFILNFEKNYIDGAESDTDREFIFSDEVRF